MYSGAVLHGAFLALERRSERSSPSSTSASSSTRSPRTYISSTRCTCDHRPRRAWAWHARLAWAERLDVVGHQRLQVRLGVGTAHADVVPRARSHSTMIGPPRSA